MRGRGRVPGGLLALGCLLASTCKPSAADPEPVPPTIPASARGEPSSSEEPRSATTPTQELAMASDGSPCEQLCGHMHGCLLAEPEADARSAGALELACLGACLQGGAPGPKELASSAFAGCADLSASEQCPALLGCMTDAWPGPVTTDPAVTRDDSIDGCARGCEGLAECVPSIRQEERDLCVEACRRRLPVEQRPEFGECATGDCVAILDCLRRMLGA